MSRARVRRTLAIAPAGQPIIPGRIEWLRAEMLKTRVTHGYCSRQLAAEPCPYANIYKQCDHYVTGRGWRTEVARQSRVVASIQDHLQRLQRAAQTDIALMPLSAG